MRYSNYIYFGALLLIACTHSKNPRISHNSEQIEENRTMKNLLSDTTNVLIADLPVFFDSTQILLHPIGLLSINSSNYIKDQLGSYNKNYSTDNHLNINKHMSDQIYGNMSNILFENPTDSHSNHVLTNQIITISSVKYLREIAKETKTDYLLYSVYDKDTNLDEILNTEDICSLYISNLDGKNFNKITTDGQHYKDGRMVAHLKRFYFITIEDSNKDGFMDAKDQQHYYYIQFTNNTYQIKEYFPAQELSLLSQN